MTDLHCENFLQEIYLYKENRIRKKNGLNFEMKEHQQKKKRKGHLFIFNLVFCSRWCKSSNISSPILIWKGWIEESTLWCFPGSPHHSLCDKEGFWTSNLTTIPKSVGIAATKSTSREHKSMFRLISQVEARNEKKKKKIGGLSMIQWSNLQPPKKLHYGFWGKNNKPKRHFYEKPIIIYSVIEYINTPIDFFFLLFFAFFFFLHTHNWQQKYEVPYHSLVNLCHQWEGF